MLADLWGWFAQLRNEAYRTNNVLLRKAIELYHEGWNGRERDPKRTKLLWEQGADIARQLQNPCLELFFIYWTCECLIFFLEDIRGALDRTIRMVVETKKPEYSGCPVMARVYRVMADAYLFTDPLGYAVEIFDLYRYMDNQVALDNDTKLLLLSRRAYLASTFREYDEALELRIAYLDASQGNDYRLTDAYLSLSELTLHLGDETSAYEYVKAAEVCARRENLQSSIAKCLAWQGFYLLKQGDSKAASRLRQEGIRLYGILAVKRSSSYYNALCHYDEHLGQFDQALTLRRQQLAELADTGQIYSEFSCRAKICRLLVMMGLPHDEDEKMTRQVMSQLRDPSIPALLLEEALHGEEV